VGLFYWWEDIGLLRHALARNLYGSPINPRKLETREVFRKRVHKVLQHGDRDVFAQANTRLGVASIVNSREVAAHRHVESQFILSEKRQLTLSTVGKSANCPEFQLPRSSPNG
jgi:hypothetical protein